MGTSGCCIEIADGYDRDFIRETMEKDRDDFLMRMTESMKIYRAIGDSATVRGVIGANLGEVTMLSNMSAPSKLRPAMAVALSIADKPHLLNAKNAPPIPFGKGP